MKKPIVIEILIWILILLAVIGLGIYGYIKTFIEPNVYVVQFRDIDGITKGSPVRFMGINVGYVRKLKSKNTYSTFLLLQKVLLGSFSVNSWLSHPENDSTDFLIIN